MVGRVSKLAGCWYGGAHSTVHRHLSPVGLSESGIAGSNRACAAMAHNAELGIHDQRICDDYIQGVLLKGDMQGRKHQLCEGRKLD